jgi:hypothetical protein
VKEDIKWPVPVLCCYCHIYLDEWNKTTKILEITTLPAEIQTGSLPVIKWQYWALYYGV